MKSSKKTIVFTICFLLSTPGFIDAFGSMIKKHRRNKALEALLAAGIIRLILKSHHGSDHGGEEHEHGHTHEYARFGHGINFGHAQFQNLGGLVPAHNLGLQNLYGFPGTGLTPSLYGLNHMNIYPGLGENFHGLGNFENFPNMKNALASIDPGHGSKLPCHGQNLQASGYAAQFPIHDEGFAGLADFPELKGFEDVQGFENNGQNQNSGGIEHGNGFEGVGMEANPFSHNPSIENENKNPVFSNMGLNYDSESTGYDKTPITQQNTKPSYSYEAYETPRAAAKFHSSNVQKAK